MGSTGRSVSRGDGAETPLTPSSETKTTSVFDTALNLDGRSRADQRAEVARLQSDMGQTGYEAGDPNETPRRKLYVKTSKAFDINYYLNTGKVGSPSSDWTRLGYTESDIKNAINQMDNGMKPMSEDVVGYRYVSLGSAARIFGMSKNDVANTIIQMGSNPAVADSLRNVLTSTNYTQRAYSSLSYDKRHGTFDSYPIRFRTVVSRGSNAIVTNNHAEHEIIVHRDAQYTFTGDARLVTERSSATGGNKTYLEIDVIV